jgi:hypothetical protein
MTDALLASIDSLTGADLAALGLVTALPEGRRVPKKPGYKLDKSAVVPFNVYWGYWYRADGEAFALQQDVNTGQKYGLASRDQIGRCVILNGLRVIFYEEALHTSCKVIEVGNVSGAKIQTANMKEAMDFLCTLRPEWKGFIEQSVLVQLSMLKERDHPDRWAQNLRRRLLEVTNVPGASDDIFDMDFVVDRVDDEETPNAPVASPPPPPNPRAVLPDWSLAQPVGPGGGAALAISEEVAEPPTRQDRPILVQLQTVDTVQNRIISNVSDAQLSRIKSHAHYWLRTKGHKSGDVFDVCRCEGGVQMTMALKIEANSGLDRDNRGAWLQNFFNGLKLQIENGTVPRKKDGKTTVPAVENVAVSSVRCAYP